MNMGTGGRKRRKREAGLEASDTIIDWDVLEDMFLEADKLQQGQSCRYGYGSRIFQKYLNKKLMDFLDLQL